MIMNFNYKSLAFSLLTNIFSDIVPIFKKKKFFEHSIAYEILGILKM